MNSSLIGLQFPIEKIEETTGISPRSGCETGISDPPSRSGGGASLLLSLSRGSTVDPHIDTSEPSICLYSVWGGACGRGTALTPCTPPRLPTLSRFPQHACLKRKISILVANNTLLKLTSGLATGAICRVRPYGSASKVNSTLCRTHNSLLSGYSHAASWVTIRAAT